MGWRLIQSKKAAVGAAGSSVSVTMDPTAGGNLLVIGVTWSQSAITFASLSDDIAGGGNTYLQVNSQVDAPSTPAIKTRLYYVASNKASAGTFNITLALSTSSGFPLIIVLEFAGESGSPLDQHAEQTGGASTTPTSGATANRSSSSELLVGWESEHSTGVCTHTPGANYIKPTNGSEDDGTAFGTGGIEYQFVSVVGTDAADWTIGENTQWNAFVATFTPSPPAGSYSLFPKQKLREDWIRRNG